MSSAAADIGDCWAVVSATGLEPLLSRLSAADRARITWAVGAIHAELCRLYEAEPTRDAIAGACKALLVKLRKLQGLVESALGEREQIAPNLDALIGGELAALRAYVEPDAASAADWVWYSALRPWQTWIDSLAVDEATAIELRATWQTVEEAELHELDAPEGGLLRSQWLLLAAFEGARRRLDVARATELAYLAFDHACEGVDALAALGIRLADYSAQTTEERVKRTIRSADALRAVLTVCDMETLRAARLGS
jgi:hypothetical protein